MIFEYINYVLGAIVKKPFSNKRIKDLDELINMSKIKSHSEEISIYLNSMLQDETKIEITDFGAGSKKNKGNIRQVKEIARNATIKAKHGVLIQNLIQHFNYKNSIELGSSLGIGTTYLAQKLEKVISIEGCSEIHSYAKKTINHFGFNNVVLLRGEFSSQLEKAVDLLDDIDIVYIDGNHQYQATLDYYNYFKTKMSKNGCLVFDDIYWSEGMVKAWREIKKDASFTVDLFKIGIVFIDQEIEKPVHLKYFY